MKRVRRGSPSLATSKSLSDFYLRRAAGYGTVLRALSGPPTAETLRAIAELSEGTDDLKEDSTPASTSLDLPRELEAALADYAALSLTVERRDRTPCVEPVIPLAVLAYVSGEIPTHFVGAEALYVLSALSHRIADAIKSGNLLLASDLSDLHGRYLGSHAEDCLADLARFLSERASSHYAPLSGWLRRMIEEDLAHFGGGSKAGHGKGALC